MSDLDKKDYKQILKSTSIMGGTSVITILLRIIRTKVLAVFLGPTGIGLIGIYDSIVSLTTSVAGLGIGNSGVRQIAEAAGSDDGSRISRTIISLRRVALISGAVGCCLLLLMSDYISQLTFGDSKHTHDLALISITIFFASVSSGQTALIQGMRRIRDLATLNILGAFFGTLLSIPIIFIFGEKGIALFMIVLSAMSIITSWWFSRRITVLHIHMNWRDVLSEAKPLLRLGLVFMSTALMAAGTLYLLRVLVVRNLGLASAGIYQAATTLSSLYVGFILQAMGMDFYPRLTAIAHDNRECISLINKQIEVALLLAVPGILATMTFAPLVINVFYSSNFSLAVEVLRWQILGILLRVFVWPMGFIFLAKGNGKLFFWTELFANCMHLSLIWIGIKYFGLPGAGMAFFIMYLFYLSLIFWIVRIKYSFQLSSKNLHILTIITLATAVVFLTPYFLSELYSLVINAAITISIGYYAFKSLIDISGTAMITGFLLKLKSRFAI